MNVKIRKGFLSNFFKPSIYLRSFKDINFNRLKIHKIKLMICELDNTLVPHYTKLFNKVAIEFIEMQKSLLFQKQKKLLNQEKNLIFKIIFVSDQIIMNILIANHLKCKSIFQPLVSSDYKMSSFNLFLENKIYKNLEKKNILKKGDFSSSRIGGHFELL